MRSSAASLLLACFLARSNGHAFPRQTVTVEYHELDVRPYPLQPTSAPRLPRDAFRRQQIAINTICGYVNGDPDLPATCSAGSHCVVDQDVGAIGCCPNGRPCTTGVFTGCVDANSGPQTEVNPYVHTCGGSEVCYRNVFEGGFFQFGCGSASDMAATVMPTASGLTAARAIETISAPMTEEPNTLSQPTTIGSLPTPTDVSAAASSSAADSSTDSVASSVTSSAASSRASPTESSHSDSSSSFASSSSAISSSAESSLSASQTSPTASAPPPESSGAESSTEESEESSGGGGGGVDRQAAIIGGSVSGAAVLIGLVALAFFLSRKKARQNKREGPGGNQTTEYISPMSGGGTAFSPVAPSREAYEQFSFGGKGIADPAHYPVHSSPPLDRSFGYEPSGEGMGTRPQGTWGGTGPSDDRTPLTQEYSDFSRGFSDALSRIDEEDSRPSTGVNGSSMSNGHGYGTEEPPLWQQNRRQTRNLMWMEQ